MHLKLRQSGTDDVEAIRAESSVKGRESSDDSLSAAVDSETTVAQISVAHNYFLRKQLSNQGKKLFASRSRAQDLCAKFELSETKCTDLSKMPSDLSAGRSTRSVSITGTPQFAAALSIKQAMKAFATKQTGMSTKVSIDKEDPLLTDRERKMIVKQREVDRRKQFVHSQLSPASQISKEPALATWTDRASNATKETDSTASDSAKGSTSTSWPEKGMSEKKKQIVVPSASFGGKEMLDIAPISPGSTSVAPTEPNTPSPKSQPSFQSMDGRARPYFRLPRHSLC